MKFSFDEYKKLPIQVKAASVFFICSVLQKGISVFTTPIFTRMLSEEEYGRFGTFSSWYEILVAIVSLSLVGGVYTTALVKNENERNTLASSAQGLLLFSCCIWITVYSVFYKFWNSLFSLSTVQMITMAVLILTSTSFGLWAIEQRVTYHYKRLATITILVSLAKPIIGISLVTHSSDKVTARIIGLLFVEIVCYAWIIVYQFIRGKQFFSKKYWSYFFCYSLPLIPHSISQTVLNSSDRIMIQSLSGDREAGIYYLGYSVALIMIIVNTALSQTLAPWTYQKLKDNKEKEINRIAILSCIVIAVMNLVLIAVAPEIISVFAPADYAEAVYVIPPVAMSVYLMYLYDWFVRVEYYYEKTHYVLVASISGAVVNLILNYVLIPIFGYLVAGYTTLVSFGVYTVLHYYFMRKICKEKMSNKSIYNEKQLLLITLVFISLGLCLNFTYSNWVIRYIILFSAMVTVIVYRKRIFKTIKGLFSIKGGI